MFKTILTAAAAIAATTLTVTATAASAQDVRTVAVFTGDLNLASAQGQATLDARLRTAVNAVCADQQDYGGMAYGRCLAVARKSAAHGRQVMVASAGKSSRIEIASR